MEFTTMDVTTLNPTGAMDPRYVIRENDVLFGRGNHTKNHPGNIYYRSLVSSVKDIYSNYRKERKQVISELIYDCIKSLNPPGLFVHEVQSDRWEEVNKQGALRKISQALREKKCLTPTEHSLDRKQAKEEEQIQWMKTMLEQVAQKNQKPPPIFTNALWKPKMNPSPSSTEDSSHVILPYSTKDSSTIDSFHLEQSAELLDSQQSSHPSTPPLHYPLNEPVALGLLQQYTNSLNHPFDSNSSPCSGSHSRYNNDSYEVASVLSLMKFERR